MTQDLRAVLKGLISEDSVNNTLFIIIKLPSSFKMVFKKRGNVMIIAVVFYTVQAQYSAALSPP